MKRAILLLLVLAGCDSKPPPDPLAKEKAAVETGLKQVRASLKDPESARFRNLHLHWNESQTWTSVCGEANAKNSFGGYVGFRRFATGGMMGVEFESERGSEAEARSFDLTWRTYCAPETLKYKVPES